MSVYVGTIEDFPTFPTGPTAGDYELGPFEFTPKAILAMAVADADNIGLTGGDVWRLSYGFAADGSSTRAVNMMVEERGFYPHHFVQSASVASTHLLRWGGNSPQTNVVVSTWDACTLTLTISNPAHADIRMFYMVFGGDTFEAFVGSVTVKASGATSTVSGLPFEPDCVMMLGGQNSPSAGYLSVGYGINGGDQYAVGKRAFDNGPPGSTVKWGTGRIARDFDWDAQISSYTSDGFVITPMDTPGADTPIYYLALHDTDGDFEMGVVELEDATTDSVSLGWQPDALFSLMGFMEPTFPSGILTTGMYGEDPLSLGTDRSGVCGAGTFYQGGGPGDPWTPPRFSFQYVDDDRILSLWAPQSGFSPGAPHAATELARIDFDGWVAGDGFTYTEDTQIAAVSAGGWPTGTWPASPATEWSWLALRTSPATEDVDPCVPSSVVFVPQIYRRL